MQMQHSDNELELSKCPIKYYNKKKRIEDEIVFIKKISKVNKFVH